MVLSRLDARVVYDENRLVYDDDVGYEASLYELLPEQLEYKIKVAIGKIKWTYVDKEIVFFPIYLLRDEEIVMRIGLFEILAKDMQNFLNESKDIDLTKLSNNEPLLYNYANKKTLRDYRTDGTKVIIKDDDDNIEVVEDEVFNAIEPIGKKEIEIENEELAKKIRESYVERMNTTWIEKFMKNNNYSLIDNEGGGDCLFYVIRDAFLGLGKETTISKLRNLLSYEADESTFEQYKVLHDNYKSALVSSKEDSEKVKKELTVLKDKFKLTKDRNTQVMLQKQMKDKVDSWNRIKSEIEVMKENYKEVKIMSGVKNLEQFRKKIRSCDFWGDTWALSTMERVLNVKFILLSSEAYETDDKDNVLTCGQMNDVKLSEIGVFNPDYYLILDFVGNHFKLITYNEKRILNFEEIPHDLKKLILLKCMESNDGYYNLIPEFAELKEKYKETVDTVEDDEIIEEQQEKLYSEEVVFQIYPKSNDKPLPGKGSGEKIEPTDKRFGELNKIMNWRRKLSDSWESSFELDNKNWNSVEHYINGNKFLSKMDFYNVFALESGSEISKNVEMAITAGQEKKNKLRPRDVNIDEDYESNKSTILEKALIAKYNQDEELKKILLLTKDAKILLYRRGKEPIILKELMRVREKLNK